MISDDDRCTDSEGVRYLRVASWADGDSLWRKVRDEDLVSDLTELTLVFAYVKSGIIPGGNREAFRVYWRGNREASGPLFFTSESYIREKAPRIQWALRRIGVDWAGVGKLYVSDERAQDGVGSLSLSDSEVEVYELLGGVPYAWATSRLFEWLGQ